MNIGLALGGGAARGWAHLGVLEVLRSRGLKVKAVAGTSIGALIGAFAAADKLDELKDISLSFGRRQAFKLFDPVFPVAGFVDGRKVERFLREHLGEVNIEELPIPFAAIAVDLCSGEPIEFHRGPVVDAVRASISIPGVFKPVLSQGRCLVDGGLANPLPVDVVRRMGCDRVIAVDLNKDIPPSKGDQLPNIMQVLNSTVVVMERQLTQLRLELDPPDLVIRPELSNVGMLDFHEVEAGIDAGREAAESALDDFDLMA